MLYAKFKDHRTSGSGEKDFKGVSMYAHGDQYWSCNLDHLQKLWFPLPKEAPNKIWF